MLCPVATITFCQLFAIPIAGSPSVVHGRNPDRVAGRGVSFDQRQRTSKPQATGHRRDRYVGVRLLGTRSDGLDAYLSVYSYTGRERRDDDDEGDDPSVASSHGLSSDDHDDRDAHPTAACQVVQGGGSRLTRVRGVPFSGTVRPKIPGSIPGRLTTFSSENRRFQAGARPRAVCLRWVCANFVRIFPESSANVGRCRRLTGVC